MLFFKFEIVFLFSCYRGKVLTNFFISAFAVNMVLLSLIDFGAMFQIFLLSFIKVDFVTSEKPFNLSIPCALALDSLKFVSTGGTIMFKGHFSMFIAFHASVIFIWAFILFTEVMFIFVIRVSADILSDILLLFRNLIVAHVFYVLVGYKSQMVFPSKLGGVFTISKGVQLNLGSLYETIYEFPQFIHLVFKFFVSFKILSFFG